MRELGIDIETYSSFDLTECGVYRYVEAEDFTILLFSYSVDNGPVRCCDFAMGETLPSEILDALRDPAVVKTAFNAAFERICISRYFDWPLMDPAQWQCTMVRAARMGLPLSLKQCGEVLRLEQGKMAEGRLLIRYFSLPAPRTGKRHFPMDAPDRWQVFKQYNIRDVEVEQQILAKVRRLEAAPFDERLYIADQHINDRGVQLDRRMAENAARFNAEYTATLLTEMSRLTGITDKPNSLAKLKAWLSNEHGVVVESLSKKNKDEVDAKVVDNPKAAKVLSLHKEVSKTSNKKYDAMLECVCNDGRIHGLLQFCGAPRTGRWAGRLVQVQNLPQNHLKDLDYARQLVKAGDLENFLLNYNNPTQVLSELIRTAFVAKDGCTFHVCDFSAIEARVIAWLAGEKWVLDVFKAGGDIYCATAGQMFHCNVEKHGENAHLRQKGKIAVLALGYEGSVAALEAMGGSRMGLTADEEREIVDKWRGANPNIVELWKAVKNAAFKAIRTGESVTINQGVTLSYKWGMLLITLPSGRTICYPRTTIGKESTSGWDREVIEYEGVNQFTKQWGKIRTYGGKLTENIVQAIARDILGCIILRAEDAGLKIVFHIHDEIVVEAEPGQTLQEVERLFSEPIEWCKDLPLKGAGYSTPYYLKD